MSNAIGVDVSHHTFISDFDKLVAAGHSFLGIKATQGGSFVDPRLAYHRDGIRSAPGIAGAIYYHYPSGGPPADEAAHFLSAIGPLRDNEALALDVEQGPTGNGAMRVEWQQAWVRALPQRRLAPLIYTAAHVWNEIGNPPWADATTGMVGLWLKRYAKDYGACPSPWSYPTFWQNGDAGIVPGVSGPCDTNVFVPGDVDALRAYFGAGA